MKRALAFGFAFGFGLLFAIAGCRALVGIEDLDPPPPTRPDGGGQQGRNDGGPDQGPGGGKPDAALSDSCRGQGQECRKCCKTAATLHDTFEGAGPGAQCICDRGNCKDKCSPNGACTPGPLPSSTPGTPDDCIICLDDALRSGVCTDACKGDADCVAALKCMEDCPSP